MIETCTLRTGITVLAKRTKDGTLRAVQYANVTQAERRVTRLHLESNVASYVLRSRPPARGFYVAVIVPVTR